MGGLREGGMEGVRERSGREGAREGEKGAREGGKEREESEDSIKKLKVV